MPPTLAIAPKQPTRTGWALLLTSVAFFMVTLDSLVVVTALPAIHRELGGQVSTLEWAVNAYLLVFAAGIITAASIGERFGRRRVYVAGLALFSLASAACALAPSTTLLIAARAMQGLGAAIVTPLSLTILTTAFGPERRGRVIGIWGSIAGLAVAAGPLVGGGVTQGLNWHWVFWVNVPVVLGLASGPVRSGVPALVPGVHALEGRLAGLPAGVGAGEEYVEVLLRAGLRGADGSDHLRIPAMHAGCALRRRGGQHNPPGDRWPDQRDLLGDEAADGEPERVHLAQLQGGDERDRFPRHLFHGARCRFPCRGSTGTRPASGCRRPRHRCRGRHSRCHRPR
jgi:hypothetical protein